MVLTVDKYTEVRLAFRDGMGVNDLARTFHHSKRKIRSCPPMVAKLMGTFYCVLGS